MERNEEKGQVFLARIWTLTGSGIAVQRSTQWAAGYASETRGTFEIYIKKRATIKLKYSGYQLTIG